MDSSTYELSISTVEDCARKWDNYCWENKEYQKIFRQMAQQLLDTMRENERLKKALYTISVNPYAHSEDANYAKMIIQSTKTTD